MPTPSMQQQAQQWGAPLQAQPEMGYAEGAPPPQAGEGYWPVPAAPADVSPLQPPCLLSGGVRPVSPLRDAHLQVIPEYPFLSVRPAAADAPPPPIPPQRRQHPPATPVRGPTPPGGVAPSPLEPREASAQLEGAGYAVVPPYQTGAPVGYADDFTPPPTQHMPYGAAGEAVDLPQCRSQSGSPQEGSPSRYATIGGEPMRGEAWLLEGSPPGAGLPARPRRVGKKAAKQWHAAAASPVSPAGGAARRRIGVRTNHVLPGDYGAREWRRVSDDIGHGVPGASEGYQPKPETHDERMMKWQRDDTRGERAGYNPPGGWETCLPADGYRGRALPNSACMFADEADMMANKDEAATVRTTRTGAAGKHSNAQKQTFNIFDTADRNTRPRKTLPSDIPPRPPGCGSGAPAPARHQWREPEPDHPTVVGRDDRPRTLPRTDYNYLPSQPIASAYTIFTKDPFSPDPHKPVTASPMPPMSPNGPQRSYMPSRGL